MALAENTSRIGAKHLRIIVEDPFYIPTMVEERMGSGIPPYQKTLIECIGAMGLLALGNITSVSNPRNKIPQSEIGDAIKAILRDHPALGNALESGAINQRTLLDGLTGISMVGNASGFVNATCILPSAPYRMAAEIDKPASPEYAQRIPITGMEMVDATYNPHTPFYNNPESDLWPWLAKYLGISNKNDVPVTTQEQCMTLASAKGQLLIPLSDMLQTVYHFEVTQSDPLIYTQKDEKLHGTLAVRTAALWVGPWKRYPSHIILPYTVERAWSKSSKEIVNSISAEMNRVAV